MTQHAAGRGAWGSKLGFILAAAGSAIGLGNIWRFPTEAGRNGGAAFVLVYLLCVVLVGVSVMIAELTMGRRAKSDPVGTYKFLAPGSWWKIFGFLGVLCGLGILSFYSVVAGWTLKYIGLTVGGAFVGADFREIQSVFENFVSDGPAVVFYQFLFLALTVWIVRGGVEGGIERASKVLMPLLLAILILLVVRAVTLPGAAAGLSFYLNPDFSKIDAGVVLAALGQAFFSLSVGMGAMITYGSYLSRRDDLVSSAFYVSASDLFIALLAGFAIFPALFSVAGLVPEQGPEAIGAGLIFMVLPNIFNAIPLGQLFGAGFFILLAIAALTSAISLLEVVVAYLIDQRGWQRKRAALSVGVLAFLLGVPSALGNGYSQRIGGIIDVLFSGFLDRMDLLFGQILLVVGALFICLFVGWKWGIHNALQEIRVSNPGFRLASAWSFLIRFACPAAIGLILVNLIYRTFLAS